MISCWRLNIVNLARDAFKDAKTEEDAAVVAGKLAKARLDLDMLKRQATIGTHYLAIHWQV